MNKIIKVSDLYSDRPGTKNDMFFVTRTNDFEFVNENSRIYLVWKDGTKSKSYIPMDIWFQRFRAKVATQDYVETCLSSGNWKEYFKEVSVHYFFNEVPWSFNAGLQNHPALALILKERKRGEIEVVNDKDKGTRKRR